MAKIVQKPNEEPIPAEIIVDEILEISAAMKKLNNSRLKRDAIVTLIAHRSKVARSTIQIVLNNLDALEEEWLKPKAGKQ